MLLTALHRPNNLLITRLGLGSNWKTNPSHYLPKKVFNFLGQVYLPKYFQTLFKSGTIYSNHVFFNKYFFPSRSLTMPIVRSQEHLFKFFRLVRLKYSIRFKAKRNYLMRKYLKYLNISELCFLRTGSFILVMLYILIPEPLKRRNFILNTSTYYKVEKRHSYRLNLQYLGLVFEKAYNFF